MREPYYMDSIRRAVNGLMHAVREYLMQGGELDLRIKELLIAASGFTYNFNNGLLNKEEIEILEKSNSIIFSDLSGMFSASQLSQQTGTSKKMLNNIYQKSFGKKFQEFQYEIKMKRAFELILTTSLSIKEICYSVGYKNVSNFSESFKKYYGYPPSRLREPKSST